jgi:AraC-like DNA-binding protein
MPSQVMHDRYTTAAGMGAGLVAFAATYGVDLKPECQALDLDPQVFESLTGRVSLDALCKLLERCAELTGDEAFGIHYARYYKSGSTGPYGYGLMVAPTLGDFLRFQTDHMQYASQASYAKLSIKDNMATFCWTYSPTIYKRAQYVDLGLALIFKHLRGIIGNAIFSLGVDLERSAPKDDKPFREAFGNHIRYRQHLNRLCVPQALLATENPKADPQLFKLMDMQCRSLHPTLNENSSFLEEIRDFIFSRLADDDISLSSAAQFFNVSERTLQRRLSDNDTTLHDLRDEARRNLASKMLAETAMSASEICYRLGYSAPSAFTRSFQRWFGISPKEFRRTHSGRSDQDHH